MGPGAKPYFTAPLFSGAASGPNPEILKWNRSPAEGNVVIRGLFVGLSTIDLVYQVDELPSPDSKVTASSQVTYAGGPATNAAITFRHLGGEAELITAVGRHPITALIRDELNTYGVKLLDLSPEWADAPPISAVAVNPAGQRNVISANATRIHEYSDQVVPELLHSASLLLVDGHLMKACIAWARAASEHRVPVVLDGGSWKPHMELLLPYVESAICSSNFQPPGCSSQEQVIEFLQKRGVRQIAITAGAKPIRFAWDQGSGSIPIPEVPAVDTMGAGDILHGACCYFLASGLSFPDALTRAASIASTSCQFHGTRAWMNQ